MQEDLDTIIISEEESQERLDKVLARRFSGIKSRTYFQMLIDQQRVLLNGEPVKKRIKPQPGDEVQIHFILTPEIGLSPENIPLDIIYEDEYLIAINKPVGMVVHPAIGNWTGTFVNALLYHCQQLHVDPQNPLRPGIVHRLDKDTSGVLIAAKTTQSQQRLIEIFSGRKIEKEYLAVCLGNPGNAKIEAPIGRHSTNRRLMSVVESGKPAVTLCKTLGTDGKVSVAEVMLKTGRTHQIRVHMKFHGTPILGDATYGNTQANQKYHADRQLLHAKSLRFEHPITGKPLLLEAPIPADIAIWMKKLKASKQ